MKVDNTCKITAQYLKNYIGWAKTQKHTGTWGVNTTIVSFCNMPSSSVSSRVDWCSGRASGSGSTSCDFGIYSL